MDLKEMYCERAEEIAWDLYDKEFCYLSKELQEKVWLMAERGVMDDYCDYSDNLRKAQKENV